MIFLLTLICGPSGYGKTRKIYEKIENCIKESESTKLYFLVPEQESVKAEKAFLTHFGNTVNERAELLNFSRLANRVFREVGGITYDYIDNGGKDLIVSTILEDAGEELSSFRKSFEDEEFISELRGELDRLRLLGITPDILSELSQSISNKELIELKLVQKLRELSTLSTLYQGAIVHGKNDALNDLTRLSLTLDDYDFFDNSCVFVDGFYDFTYPEYEILKRVINSAENTYITLPLAENDTENIFEKPINAMQRLLDICEECSVEYKIEYLDSHVKKQAPALEYLSKRLVDGKSEEDKPKSSGEITLMSCPTPYDECVYVAREIVKLVKNGKKFSDIAICAGNIADYGSMLEDVLEKYNVRFLSTKTNTLDTLPLVNFIFLSLDAVSHNFYLPKMKRLLESAYLCLDKEEKFVLSNYISTWNISAALWCSDSDWVMNPKGYIENKTPEQIEELSRVNTARKKVIAPLISLRDGLKNSTVAKKAEAVWKYLEQTGAKSVVEKRAKEFSEKGLFSKARDEISAWNMTLEAFDRLCDTVGERQVSLERFLKYMRIVFKSSSFGHIPSSTNEVEIGNIGFVRTSDITDLFLIGFNEGSLGSNLKSGSVFSENELMVLERFNDLFKLDSKEALLRTESFFLHVAVSTPKDSLHLSYHTSSALSSDDRASFFVPMIESYVEIEKNSYEKDFPVTKKELLEWVMKNREAENFEQILTSLREKDQDFAEELLKKVSKEAFLSDKIKLQRDKKDKKINMTQARLDTFARCPFSYYSNYMLSIRKTRKAEFKAAEMGSLVHKVLEEVLSALASKNIKLQSAEESLVREMSLDSAKEHLRRVAPEISESSKRFKYLISRLVSFVLYIIENMKEEFENSDFIPVLFEEKMEEGSAIPPYKVDLGNGDSLVFYGSVDRVDLYEDTDGKKYLRVVDYKTKIGGKKFDLNDVINGINLQLLVYLFAAWQNPDETKSVPAGIMYMPASRPSLVLESMTQTQDEKKLRDDEMKRSGLFLFDEKILSAMEHGLEGRVLPIKKNKNGTFSSSASLATLEQFGALKRYTDKTFINLAKKLQDGEVSASPIVSSNLDSCQWCDFKAFCRYEGCGRDYVKYKHPWEEIDK